MKLTIEIDDRYLEQIIKLINDIEDEQIENTIMKYLRRGVCTFHAFAELALRENKELEYDEKTNTLKIQDYTFTSAPLSFHLA